MCDNCITNIFPLKEASKFHFVLKLWLVTTNESVNCLRWSSGENSIIVDLSSLGNNPYMSEMFTCPTVDDFLWLLKYNGFEQCSPQDMDIETGKNDAVYQHAAFVMSNGEHFRTWLHDASKQLLDGSMKNDCSWTQPGSFVNEFRCRQIPEHFQRAKANITADMKLLDIHIRREYEKNKGLSTNCMNIPSQYCDMSAIQCPGYMQTTRLAGNYGMVDLSELQDFFGVMLPFMEDISDADPATLKEDNIIDANTEAETEPLENSVGQPMYVAPNSELGANLSSVSNAVAEFDEICASLDFKLFEKFDYVKADEPTVFMSQEIRTDPQQALKNANYPYTESQTIIQAEKDIKSEPSDMSSVGSFCDDEERPTKITNCMRDILNPLDFD